MENEVPGVAVPGGNFQLNDSLSELPSITGLEGLGGTASSQASFAGGNEFLRKPGIAQGEPTDQGPAVADSMGSSADFNFLRGSKNEGQAPSTPSQAVPSMPAGVDDVEKNTQAVAEALKEAAALGSSQTPAASPATGSGSQGTGAFPSESQALPELPGASHPAPNGSRTPAALPATGSGSQGTGAFPSESQALPELPGASTPAPNGSQAFCSSGQPSAGQPPQSVQPGKALPEPAGHEGKAPPRYTKQPPVTADASNGTFGGPVSGCGGISAGALDLAMADSSGAGSAEPTMPGTGSNPVPPPWQNSRLLRQRPPSEADACENGAGGLPSRISEPHLPPPRTAPPLATESKGGWVVQGRIQPEPPRASLRDPPAQSPQDPLQSSRMRQGQPQVDAQPPPWLNLLQEVRDMWSAGIVPGQPSGLQPCPNVQQPMPPHVLDAFQQQWQQQQLQQQRLQQMQHQPPVANWQNLLAQAPPSSAPPGHVPPPKSDASPKVSKEVQADGRSGARELQMQQDLSGKLQQFRSQHLPELRQRRDELAGAVQAIEARSAELRQRCAEAEREGREDFEVLRSHLNSVKSLKQAVLDREGEVRQRLIDGIDDFVRQAHQAEANCRNTPEAVASFMAEYPDLQTAVDTLCSRACSLPQVDVPIDDIPFEARTRADKLRRYVVADRLLRAKDLCLWRLEQQRRQLSSEVQEGAEWIRHLGSLLDSYAEELGQVCYFCAERFCAASANTRCVYNLGASPRSGRPLAPDPRVPQHLWGAGVHFWVPLPAPASAAAASASMAAPGFLAPGTPSAADIHREMWPYGQLAGLPQEPPQDAVLREPILSRHPTPPQACWPAEPHLMAFQPSQAPSSSSRAPSPSPPAVQYASPRAMNPQWAFGGGGPAPVREPSAGPVSATNAGLQGGMAFLHGSSGGGGPLPPPPPVESGLSAPLPQPLPRFQPIPSQGQAFSGDPAAQELWQRVGRSLRERGVLLRQAFALFDSDGDGAVSRQEVAEAFRLMRLGLDDLEIERLLRDIDTNQDGLVNLQEFGNRLHFLDMLGFGS